MIASLQKGRTPSPLPLTRLWVWPIMLKDEILLSMTHNTWLATLHFGPYLARRAVIVAWSNQLANHVKPLYLYDCPDCILQNALVVNKYPSLFYFKGARRQWLRINCVERNKTFNHGFIQGAQNSPPGTSILANISPSQPRQMGILLDKFKTKVVYHNDTK